MIIKNEEMNDTPRTDSIQNGDFNYVNIWFSRELERENNAMRELLNESYQFFRSYNEQLHPWHRGIDAWCEKAEKFRVKKTDWRET